MAKINQNIYFFHDRPERLAGYDSRELVPTVVWYKILQLYYLIRSNTSASVNDSTLLEEMILQHKDMLAADLDISLKVAEIYKEINRKLLWATGSAEELAILNSQHAYNYIRFVLGSRVNNAEYLDVFSQMNPESLARIIGAQSNVGISPFNREAERKLLDQAIAPHATAALLFSIISRRRVPSAEQNLRHMTSLKWRQVQRSLNRYGTDNHDTAWDYYLRCLESSERTAAIRLHGVD